jgi:hypothetical protein
LRKSEHDLPTINVQRSTPTTEGPQLGIDGEESPVISGMRTPGRGASGAGSTLETVQEISQPGTPAVGLDGSREQSTVGLHQLLEQSNTMEQAFAKSLKSKTSTVANESGSESGSNKDKPKMRSASLAPALAGLPPNTVPPSKSFSAGTAVGRSKPSGEGSTKNMTVETETVSSIPQVAVGGGAGAGGINGSLRLKPSSETIRPKKDKKKTVRKAPSVASGTGELPNSCSHKPYTSILEFHSLTSQERHRVQVYLIVLVRMTYHLHRSSLWNDDLVSSSTM